MTIPKLEELCEKTAAARIYCIKHSALGEQGCYTSAVRDNFTFLIMGLELAMNIYRRYSPHNTPITDEIMATKEELISAANKTRVLQTRTSTKP